MSFRNFLASKVNSKVNIKVIWPEKNKTIIGRSVDFSRNSEMLSLNVFDFMVSDPELGYNLIVWLTRSKDTMFDL